MLFALCFLLDSVQYLFIHSSIQNPQSLNGHIFLFPSIYFGKNEKVFTDFLLFFQNIVFPCMPRNEKHVPSRDTKLRICSSHLLRLANPCCNACFTILFLNIIMIMPASQKRSNCAFRFGLRRLATMPTAKSGLNVWYLDNIFTNLLTLTGGAFYYFSTGEGFLWQKNLARYW